MIYTRKSLKIALNYIDLLHIIIEYVITQKIIDNL